MSDRRSAEQIAGEKLEAAVQSGCELYAKQKVARVTKIPTPIKQLSGSVDGSFRAVYQKQGLCDFYGVMTSGPYKGTAIAVECKATSAMRLPYSRVEPQQREWLDDTRLSFLLVHFLATNQVRLVRWSLLRPGMSVDALSGFRIDAVQWLAPLLDGRYS